MTVTSLVSIDLEVSRDSRHFHQLGGAHGDGSASLAFPPDTLPDALDALDRLADGAEFDRPPARMALADNTGSRHGWNRSLLYLPKLAAP